MSRKRAEKSILTYLRVANIVERDIHRLKGKSLDQSEEADVRAVMVEYEGRSGDAGFNLYLAVLRLYLIHFKGRKEFTDLLSTKRRTKKKLPRYLTE